MENKTLIMEHELSVNAYRDVIEVYKEIQREKDTEEKKYLLEKIHQLTKGKTIVLDNSIRQ